MNKTQNILDTLDEDIDVLVVGGGIVGAGVFRDLALHGVKTLLIDKKDFSSQTSRYSSKMLHGGIRYLENFDFSLVWEALHEKNLWLKLTPHLAKEQRFYLPVFNDSKRPLWMIRLGLTLYDFLSGGKNTPHSKASPEQLKEVLPGIRQEGLKGAGIYSDAVVDDLKLTLEVIYDALLEPSQRALNHVALTDLKHLGSKVEVTLEDQLSGAKKTIQVKDIVFCTGPFTDQILNQLNIPWTPKLLTSKGSHIWLDHKDLPLNSPMVITGADERVIFVIPHGKRVLVGTTEVPADENLFDPTASQDEINYLLSSLNSYFPNFNKETKIIGSFAGIRPLIASEGSDRGKTSREHRFYQPYHNLYVLVGGKYTTFRTMAQDVCAPITTKLRLSYNSDLTKRPLRQKSVWGPQDWEESSLEGLKNSIPQIISQECVRTNQDILNRCLAWPDLEHKGSELKKWLEKETFLKLELNNAHDR